MPGTLPVEQLTAICIAQHGFASSTVYMLTSLYGISMEGIHHQPLVFENSFWERLSFFSSAMAAGDRDVPANNLPGWPTHA